VILDEDFTSEIDCTEFTVYNCIFCKYVNFEIIVSKMPNIRKGVNVTGRVSKAHSLDRHSSSLPLLLHLTNCTIATIAMLSGKALLLLLTPPIGSGQSQAVFGAIELQILPPVHFWSVWLVTPQRMVV